MSKTKAARGSKVRRKLGKALERQSRVKVSRTLRGSDVIDGFVVGLGRAWVLVATLDDRLGLDGYAALRLDDVSEVDRRGGPDTFVGRALAARGEWPPVGVDIDLDDIAGLVRTAAETAPLVTLYVEDEDPDVCFIGRPVRIGRRSVRLWEIDPEAEWWDRATKWPLRGITRVDFGGGYEEALALIGGDPPGGGSTT